jgi:hypothetical protein
MLQVDLALFDERLMDLLGMAAGALLPVSDGPLVQAKGKTMAGIGQPPASKASTRTTSQAGCFRSSSGVPAVSAKVPPQAWHL